MKKINKILVINFGGIGDEILFLPTIISLKKEFPEAKITLALEPRSKGIKDLTNIIDETFLINIKFKNKYIELLRLIFLAGFGHFDLAVTAGGNKFMSIILFLTGIKNRYGYNTGKLSEILLTKTIPLNKNQYACKMYHDLVTPITANKTEFPEFNIESEPKQPNTILVHPGVSKLSVSQGMIKTVPAETWGNTIDLLIQNGKKVILAGGPDDKECIETIRRTMKKSANPNFIDYYGETKNLADLAKLISSCEVFLCSDSAPLHLAVAMKTKTYVIFGPTDYKRLIPDSPDVVPIFANDSCNLKPCLWERRQKTCPELHCLKISAEQICKNLI